VTKYGYYFLLWAQFTYTECYFSYSLSPNSRMSNTSLDLFGYNYSRKSTMRLDSGHFLFSRLNKTQMALNNKTNE